MRWIPATASFTLVQESSIPLNEWAARSAIGRAIRQILRLEAAKKQNNPAKKQSAGNGITEMQ